MGHTTIPRAADGVINCVRTYQGSKSALRSLPTLAPFLLQSLPNTFPRLHCLFQPVSYGSYASSNHFILASCFPYRALSWMISTPNFNLQPLTLATAPDSHFRPRGRGVIILFLKSALSRPYSVNKALINPSSTRQHRYLLSSIFSFAQPQV